MEKKLILALDFGNTKLAASTIFEGDKEWEKYERVEMKSCTGGEDHLNQMLELADRLLDGRIPDGVGVSFGGPVDSKSGKTLLSHTYKGWENFPLKEFLEKKYDSKVVIENDANIAALGEYAFGAGRGSSSMMFITVSTGVGGGMVLNGEVWQGSQGLAGEIGHMIVDPNGPRWWGRRGCIYRLSSGTFIARRARRWVQDEPFQGDILKKMSGNDPYKITSRMVAEAADHGDKLSKEVLDVSAVALGLGIANTANIMNLEMFVIGGSVIKAGSRFWSEIVRVANESKMPEIEFKMKRAELGDEAPLWGAMELARREINKK